MEKYSKEKFTFIKSQEFQNILGDNYYLVYVKNNEEKLTYYIFSQQVNKPMEFELSGLFENNNSKTFSSVNSCCCLNNLNKWEIYIVKSENSKCPDMKICSVTLFELCEN